jgi:hypothetical protein
MAPPKKPLKVLQMTGSVKKNPKRYKNRGKTLGPAELGALGDPPQHLTIDQQACWHELAEIDAAQNRLLCRPDRIAVELAATMMADYRQHPEMFSSARMTQLQRLLRSFGMVGPSSRQDIPPPQEPASDDPLAEFLRDS